MAPFLTFKLDADGFNRFVELLASAGMRFVEQQRELLPVSKITIVYGELVSPHGTYPQCELRSGGGEYEFDFMMRGRDKTLLAVLDDLKKAFSGHLLDRKIKPQSDILPEPTPIVLSVPHARYKQ